MKTIIEYIDDLKEKNGSDYKTAQLLNISKESVSQIRKRGTVADETAIKMADLLGIDEAELLISAAVARSGGRTRTAWERISKHVSIISILMFTFQIVSPALMGVNFSKCILC